MKLNEEIRTFLSGVEKATLKEICIHLSNANKGSINAISNQMAKQGKILKVKRGVYAINKN